MPVMEMISSVYVQVIIQLLQVALELTQSMEMDRLLKHSFIPPTPISFMDSDLEIHSHLNPEQSLRAL